MAPAFIYKSSTPFSSVHHNTLVRTPDWAMAGSQSCSELVPATFLPLSVGHPRGLHLREAFSLFSPGVEPPPPPTQEAPGPRVADRQHFCVSDVGERERERSCKLRTSASQGQGWWVWQEKGEGAPAALISTDLPSFVLITLRQMQNDPDLRGKTQGKTCRASLVEPAPVLPHVCVHGNISKPHTELALLQNNNVQNNPANL